MVPISMCYGRGKDLPVPWRIPGLVLLVFWLNGPLLAQVQSGQFHLGGQFSFQFSSYQKQNSFSANLQPELGLMLSPKWSIGMGIPFLYGSSGKSNLTYRLGFAPFVRRYFDLKSGFYAILHLQGETQFNLGGNFGRQAHFGVRLIPAISYFVTPGFAFEAGFGEFSYTTDRYSTGVNDFVNRTSKFELRPTPVFGLRYYFPNSSPTNKAQK